MNSIDHIKIDKYEIVVGNGDTSFEFYALRNGEKWISDLSMIEGSNLIMSMAYEIQELRNINEQLKEYKHMYEDLCK